MLTAQGDENPGAAGGAEGGSLLPSAHVPSPRPGRSRGEVRRAPSFY